MTTSQKELRELFWEHNQDIKRVPGWTQNQYPTDIRMTWCDFVEMMRRDGLISEKLAARATL